MTFLYVANYDNDREKWKQVVALYKLEGNHILASEDLTIDIMRKVKGVGYPTYAIIDKYGKVELSKAGYPMDREVLINQLEEALKRWINAYYSIVFRLFEFYCPDFESGFVGVVDEKLVVGFRIWDGW